MKKQLLKTDSDHPSSNYESGVTSNFNNILWKAVASLIFIGSFGYISYIGLINPDISFWKSIGVWYFVFTSISVLFGLTLKSFKKQIRDIDFGDELIPELDDEGFGCFLTVFMVVFAPFVGFFYFHFGENIGKYLNQFVFWRGKAWLFPVIPMKESYELHEIESFNPFFWAWVMLFRAADEHDAHARYIDSYLARRQSADEVKLLISGDTDDDLLEGIRKNLLDLAKKELLDPNDLFFYGEVNGKSNFINYCKEYLEDKGIQVTPLHLKEAERVYANITKLEWFQLISLFEKPLQKCEGFFYCPKTL